MTKYDDGPQAILDADTMDEDGARLMFPDDCGPVVRGLLEDERAFVPLDKPCGCKRPCRHCPSHRFNANARRDFVLRRAFVILAAGFDMPALTACKIISKESGVVVNAMRKRAPRTPTVDPPSAGTIRDLWSKRPHKEKSPSKVDPWKARIAIVAGRPSVLTLLADLDKNDLAVKKLRTKRAKSLLNLFNP